MSKQLGVVDLFSGVGGLSTGFFNNPSFKLLAANEILEKTAKAYSLNHPGVEMYNKDIKNFSISELLNDLNITKNDIDIIVGGPPCQAYSTVGKRLIDDPRGRLFQEYYRILKEAEPSFFLYENVQGLLSMQGGELLKTIISLFESLGYKVTYKVLNAADYGAPQIRRRVILVGSKLDEDYKFPEATHTDELQQPLSGGSKPYLTLGEAIGDLPLISAGESSDKYASPPQNEFQKQMRQRSTAKLLDHDTPNNNSNLIKLMTALPEGGTPADLPKSLRPKSGFKNTYSRLWWDKPSTTITRNLSTPSSSRCIHPRANRPLTTREGARLQTFADDYKFYGSRADKNLQIGEAVPPFLSTALVRQIDILFKSTS